MTVTAPIQERSTRKSTGSRSRGWRLAPKTDPEARGAENRGRLWLVLSYVLCPCHLPVTMGLAVALVGGSAVGAALTASAWRLGVVLGVLYGLALWRGFHHLRRAQAAVESSEECSTRWSAGDRAVGRARRVEKVPAWLGWGRAVSRPVGGVRT